MSHESDEESTNQTDDSKFQYVYMYVYLSLFSMYFICSHFTSNHTAAARNRQTNKS